MAKKKAAKEFKAGDRFSFTNKRKVRVYTIDVASNDGIYCHWHYSAFGKDYEADFKPADELYYQGKK